MLDKEVKCEDCNAGGRRRGRRNPIWRRAHTQTDFYRWSIDVKVEILLLGFTRCYNIKFELRTLADWFMCSSCCLGPPVCLLTPPTHYLSPVTHYVFLVVHYVSPNPNQWSFMDHHWYSASPNCLDRDLKSWISTGRHCLAHGSQSRLFGYENTEAKPAAGSSYFKGSCLARKQSREHRLHWATQELNVCVCYISRLSFYICHVLWLTSVLQPESVTWD